MSIQYIDALISDISFIEVREEMFKSGLMTPDKWKNDLSLFHTDAYGSLITHWYLIDTLHQPITKAQTQLFCFPFDFINLYSIGCKNSNVTNQTSCDCERLSPQHSNDTLFRELKSNKSSEGDEAEDDGSISASLKCDAAVTLPSLSLTQVESYQCGDSPRRPRGDDGHRLKWSSAAGHGVLFQGRPEEGEGPVGTEAQWTWLCKGGPVLLDYVRLYICS